MAKSGTRTKEPARNWLSWQSGGDQNKAHTHMHTRKPSSLLSPNSSRSPPHWESAAPSPAPFVVAVVVDVVVVAAAAPPPPAPPPPPTPLDPRVPPGADDGDAAAVSLAILSCFGSFCSTSFSLCVSVRESVWCVCKCCGLRLQMHFHIAACWPLFLQSAPRPRPAIVLVSAFRTL